MKHIDTLHSLTEKEVLTSPASHLKNSTPDPQAVTAYAPDSLLTIQQLASLLNVSLATAYRLTESAQLPSFRIRRAIRVRRKDIETYLTKQRVSWDRE
ncbi:helix-turn-helix domain-containing protein [Patescibacteria group bacterium]|nr:helix-turn-helix domain-containing protein [Patescibacteria group bacterium]MBP9710243.1 helix-turn-helix domain-containing protein [Patescibacteria group bacterium]